MKISRTQPNQLFSIPRLIKRLPKDFSMKEKMRIEDQLYRIQAGFSGELKVDRYLESIEYLHSKIVLTDLHLSTRSGKTFQIDTLIVSRKYILILEVKNIKGDLYFKTNPHFLLRKLNDDSTRMECPITQMEVAKINLSHWLKQNGIHMEVHGEVVLSNQSAFIKEIPESSPVIYMKRLTILLQEMESLPDLLDEPQLQEIVKRISEQKNNYKPLPLCKTFNINPADLKIGQLCKKCNEKLVYKTERIRFCLYCEVEQPNNHKELMIDWFLLVDNSITNEQCRYFFDVKEQHHVRYILKTFGLIKKGKGKNARYYLPNRDKV